MKHLQIRVYNDTAGQSHQRPGADQPFFTLSQVNDRELYLDGPVGACSKGHHLHVEFSYEVDGRPVETAVTVRVKEMESPSAGRVSFVADILQKGDAGLWKALMGALGQDQERLEGLFHQLKGDDDE